MALTMITEKDLERANLLIDRRGRIAEILRGFNSPHVETTIGLVTVNSASPYKTSASDLADWMHSVMPDIENRLKDTARILITAELEKVKAEISTLVG